jgi:hypothetical protein
MATSMSEHAKMLCQLGIVDILKTSSECEEYQNVLWNVKKV